jgi:hypothetical protein
MFDFTLLTAGHLILGAGLTFDVLLTKHRPVSAVLWLAIVWAVPYVGALGYLSFGVDRVRRGASARDAAKAAVARRAALHPTFERLTIDSEIESSYSSMETSSIPLYSMRYPRLNPRSTCRRSSSGMTGSAASWST